jgi:hypothetical protein
MQCDVANVERTTRKARLTEQAVSLEVAEHNATAVVQKREKRVKRKDGVNECMWGVKRGITKYHQYVMDVMGVKRANETVEK